VYCRDRGMRRRFEEEMGSLGTRRRKREGACRKETKSGTPKEIGRILTRQQRQLVGALASARCQQEQW